MELAPGVSLSPKLRLLRMIGEGGMGTVWEAEHTDLAATVAVKVLATGSMTRGMIARFNREASAAARIDSPHVVTIFDGGELEDGTPYLVMEMLEGHDLAHRIDHGPRLSSAEVVDIVSQLAHALTRAHDLGIVHRDIKPDNVFLTDEDGDVFVRVLDFGIAKRFDVKSHSVVTLTGTMVGTPAYMSPEQVLSGKNIDHRSDLWSLGVLVYHALSGTIPFNGETLGAMCVAISNGVFKPITVLRPDLPPSFDAWFQRALAQAPAQRFKSAREMANALEEAAAGKLPKVPRTVVMAAPHEPALAAVTQQARALDHTASNATASIHIPVETPWLQVGAIAGLGLLALLLVIGLPRLSSHRSTPLPSSPGTTASTPAPDPHSVPGAHELPGARPLPGAWEASSSPGKDAEPPASSTAQRIDGDPPRGPSAVAASAATPTRPETPAAPSPAPVKTPSNGAPPAPVDRGF